MNGMKNTNGFSLIEVLIYIAIFAVSAIFLVSILIVVTRVQLKQASSHEVEQQISFVGETVRRYVQKSSLIDITPGITTSTLRLRVASSSADVTLIYASGTVVYLEERETLEAGGDIRITALTDSAVRADSFYVTKYENPGGFSVVQIDVALSANTTNPMAAVSRTLQTAVTRISAATFDSTVQPDSDGAQNLGAVGNRWNSAYFSGTLQVGDNTNKIQLIGSTGNLYTSVAGSGLIVKDGSGSGTSYKLYTTSSVLTASTIACP